VKTVFLELRSILTGIKKKRGLLNYSLVITDSAATTKKAIPVQNKSPPVRKYTMIATRIAGISTRKSLISTMITKPMITRIIRKVKSKPGRPRLSSTEYTTTIRRAKFINNPQIKI
jgi:hypothetical protein